MLYETLVTCAEPLSLQPVLFVVPTGLIDRPCIRWQKAYNLQELMDQFGWGMDLQESVSSLAISCKVKRAYITPNYDSFTEFTEFPEIK